MKMEVPQVDLPLEVLAWTKVTEASTNNRAGCRRVFSPSVRKEP